MDHCSLSLPNHNSLAGSSRLYFVPRYIKQTKEIGERLYYKRRYTEGITQLSDRNISIKHAVDVIHNFCHLIEANKSRNVQFITGTSSCRRSLYCLIIRSWSVDGMEFEGRFDRFRISNRGVITFWLASNRDEGMRGNMIHSDEKWEQLPLEQRCARQGELCGQEENHKRCWK